MARACSSSKEDTASGESEELWPDLMELLPSNHAFPAPTAHQPAPVALHSTMYLAQGSSVSGDAVVCITSERLVSAVPCNPLHPLHALSTPAATYSVIRHLAGSSQKSSLLWFRRLLIS